GNVLTSDNKPAEGVNIEFKDLKLFTVTDEDGQFQFQKIKDGYYTIVATFTGMQTQRLPVSVTKGEAVTVSVILKEDARDLDELVIYSRKGLNDLAPTAGKIAIDPMSLPQSVMVIGNQVI